MTNKKGGFTFLLLLIVFHYSYCFSETQCDTLTIKGIMPLHDFFDEVYRQTGWQTIYYHELTKDKNFKNITIEVNLNNEKIIKSLNDIKIYIRSKINDNYSHKLICHEKKILVGSDEPHPTGDPTSLVELKHISCDKMSEIIIQNGYKAPKDKRINAVLFYTKNRNEVMALINKYDVELKNSNEIILKPSIK